MKVKSKDISEDVRREFEMEWLPLSEVRRRIAIEDAKEEKAFEVAQRMREVAQRMRADGFSPDVITKYTGLDRDDILALS